MALILHESQMKSFQRGPGTKLVWTYNNGWNLLLKPKLWHLNDHVMMIIFLDKSHEYPHLLLNSRHSLQSPYIYLDKMKNIKRACWLCLRVIGSLEFTTTLRIRAPSRLYGQLAGLTEETVFGPLWNDKVVLNRDAKTNESTWVTCSKTCRM